MRLSSPYVLVFGGAGFIGTNLCLSALARGYQVILFDNLSRRGTDLNWRLLKAQGGDKIQLVRRDLRDAEAVRHFLAEHHEAEAIFHLAGQVAVTTSIKNPREDFEINLLGTLNILEGMRLENIQAPLLYASTNKVYGKLAELRIREEETRYQFADHPTGISEQHPLDFHSPYGCSKGGADQYVLDYARVYGLKTLVFRQSCIYGYYQFGIEDQGWVAWFTIASLFDMPITIFGDGKQVRDILFIDDLINAYWLALSKLETTAGKAYNIGGGAYQLSLRELLTLLREKLAKPIPTHSAEPRQGDQKVFVCDTRQAAQDFGWQPQISAEEGIHLLIEWVVANRALFVEAGLIPS
jgi:CDP-paratose 2-epimerase